MYVFTVTIAATNTVQPIIPSAVQPASSHMVQGILPVNIGSNTIYVGDSKVSATNGIPILATGSFAAFPAIAYAMDLNEFFVYGTQNDKMVFMVFP